MLLSFLTFLQQLEHSIFAPFQPLHKGVFDLQGCTVLAFCMVVLLYWFGAGCWLAF